MSGNTYRIKGAFFENDRSGGPAFTGFVEIDGVKTHIALWPKTSQAGVNYFQVSEDKRKNQAQAPANKQMGSPFTKKQAGGPVRPTAHPDMDDDIPFSPEF